VSVPRPATRPAPDSTVPLRYLVAAALAFVLAAAGVVWLARELSGHYYHPRLAALTHTVTLGWITLAMMGASYQLVPMLLGRPIWSERLARWQFAMLVAGVVGLAAHFYIAEFSGMLWAAGIVGAGIGAHAVNVAVSLRGLARVTFTVRLFAMGLAGLVLTLGFGALLATDRVVKILPAAGFFPTLHAHFHLALLGWVMPVVLGVTARVYPVFLLAGEPAGWPGHAQLWGLLLGVPTLTLGILASPALVRVGALLVASAVAGHAAWVLEIVRSRRRPALDWGLRFVLTGAAFLLPASALGLGLAFDVVGGPRPTLAYVALALGGWISLTIVGMMLKIVPVLVWYRVYAPHIGRTQAPPLKELGWPAVEGLAWWLLTGGMVGLAAALAAGNAWWIGAAGTVVTLGALAFGATLAATLHHLSPHAARS